MRNYKWWSPFQNTKHTNLQRPACSRAEFLAYQQKNQSRQGKHFFNILRMQYTYSQGSFAMKTTGNNRMTQRFCSWEESPEEMQTSTQRKTYTWIFRAQANFSESQLYHFHQRQHLHVSAELLSPSWGPKTTGIPNTTTETQPFSSPTPQSAPLLGPALGPELPFLFLIWVKLCPPAPKFMLKF